LKKKIKFQSGNNNGKITISYKKGGVGEVWVI